MSVGGSSPNRATNLRGFGDNIRKGENVRHSHSIVNPLEKLDFLARRRTLSDGICASSKVVYTVSFTVTK